ncbi:S49 family peptidase [Cereibacter sp. SYSU M97828]|nr:S49 family peptidase [Cereibacter flavus]
MLVDRSARVWAMRPDDLVSAQALQLRADRRESPERAVISGEWLEGSDFARIVDGVAIVPVYGPLMRTMSWWSWSYEEIGRDIALAEADSRVHTITLDIDSPGGLVAGCGDLAAAIASCSKPIHAFVGGSAASAAYWIASSCQSITLGSGAIVGSIGTVIEYVDLEPYFEKLGARIIRVVAEQSPNKRLDPESDEGKAEMQALVDASGAEFVAGVAAGRGVTDADVLANFGQGMIFEGNEAIRRGMADGRGTLDATVAGLAGRDPSFHAAPAAAAQEKPMDWASITLATLRENRADLVTELLATASSDAISAAVTAERDRILGIDDVAVAGHDDLVSKAKADGKTTPEQLALQILKAEKAAGGREIEAREKAEEETKVPPAPPRTETSSSAGDSIEDKAKAAWEKDGALRSEFGGDFAAYLAFEKANASGHARIKRSA